MRILVLEPKGADTLPLPELLERLTNNPRCHDEYFVTSFLVGHGWEPVLNHEWDAPLRMGSVVLVLQAPDEEPVTVARVVTPARPRNRVTLRLPDGSERVLHGVRNMEQALGDVTVVRCGERFGPGGPVLWLCARCARLPDWERGPCFEHTTYARRTGPPDNLIVTLIGGTELIFPTETQVVSVDEERVE